MRALLGEMWMTTVSMPPGRLMGQGARASARDSESHARAYLHISRISAIFRSRTTTRGDTLASCTLFIFTHFRGRCRHLEISFPRAGLRGVLPVILSASFGSLRQAREILRCAQDDRPYLQMSKESERLWTVLLKVLAPYQMSLKFLLPHCKKVMEKRQNRIFTCPIQVIGRFFSV